MRKTSEPLGVMVVVARTYLLLIEGISDSVSLFPRMIRLHSITNAYPRAHSELINISDNLRKELLPHTTTVTNHHMHYGPCKSFISTQGQVSAYPCKK